MHNVFTFPALRFPVARSSKYESDQVSYINYSGMEKHCQVNCKYLVKLIFSQAKSTGLTVKKAIVLPIPLCYNQVTWLRGVAQLGSALGSGPRGRRFKSSRSDHRTKGFRILRILEPLIICFTIAALCLISTWKNYLCQQLFPVRDGH